jgi:sarcosine oxidase gamma subunit
VTEQTDGWVAFDIFSKNGTKPIANICEKLVNIDVNALKPGTAVRTALHHMSVYLIRRRDDQITVIGMRTLAGALCHTLQTTALRLR